MTPSIEDMMSKNFLIPEGDILSILLEIMLRLVEGMVDIAASVKRFITYIRKINIADFRMLHIH
jgi:hypothetical protein